MRSRLLRAAALLPVAVLAGSLALSAPPATAGANLLSPDDASFGASTGGWTAVGATPSRTAAPYQSGSGALRLTATAAGNVGAYSGRVPAGAGGTYAADVWLQPDKAPRAVQSFVAFYDKTGSALGYVFGAGVTEARGAYTRTATASGVAPSGTQYALVGVLVYGVTKGEVHYADTARLEQTAAPTTSPAVPLLGFFDESFGATGDVSRLDAEEAWQGRKNAVVGVYTNFDPAEIDRVFPQITQLWNRGSVPMVSWMPWIGNTKGTDYNAEIAGGTYDDYVRAWARQMKVYLAGRDGVYGNGDDRRAYVRFGHEPNGDWYPYAPAYGGTPAASYVAMWRHVHDVVVSVGVDDPTRLAWVFSVNNVDGPVRMESLFPGDAYVDWVGIDGYNWGTSGGHQWETPSQVFDPMVKRLRAITAKPLGVNEVASTTDGATVYHKGQWITDYFSWVRANGIRMTMWFNDYPDMWEVFGGTYGDEWAGARLAYSTYRTAVQGPAFVSPDVTNPRLLTDAQFTGS